MTLKVEKRFFYNLTKFQALKPLELYKYFVTSVIGVLELLVFFVMRLSDSKG